MWGAGIDRLRVLIAAALNEMADADSLDRPKAAVALLKRVPATPDSLASVPGDADEIVRRIVLERRRREPTALDNMQTLRVGRLPLDDECYEVRLELERRAAELPEGEPS